MKKLKKLSKNKKPNVVFIYGPIAVGKLTVAKILSKKLGYKLVHNHHLNDFVGEIFDRGSYASHAIKDYLRYYLLENTVKAGMNIVATHCYRHDFVSRTGLSDPKYVKTLQKRLTKLGAKFHPIFLKADNKELLRRVGMESRKQFKKLTSKKIFKKLGYDWHVAPNIKSNLIIDNTNVSPKKVVDMIIKNFKLKK
ncbi:AAA family ATPase [Candidatus Nomurabacteria bacterium]|nr:AAA family ATPase [Candidatus Nomurabacteria bacterium]